MHTPGQHQQDQLRRERQQHPGHGSWLCMARRYSTIAAYIDVSAPASLHILRGLVGCAVLGCQHPGVRLQRQVATPAVEHIILQPRSCQKHVGCMITAMPWHASSPGHVLPTVEPLVCLVVAGVTLPYPQQKFAAEFAIQWLFLLVEPSRLFLGELPTTNLHSKRHMRCLAGQTWQHPG